MKNLKWMLLLGIVVLLFFWKIVFTPQFSITIGWECTNQAFAWYNFSVRTIQKGILPIWNPYRLSGTTFLGEPQTSIFYPFRLLLYLWPLTKDGVLSERLFHQAYVLTHIFGACFMFLFAKELGIKNSFAAFVSAVCFTFGGFFGRLGWVNLADSAMWLPLIFLFLLRAFYSETKQRRILNACYSGLCMGMAILAGSLHMPLMDVLVIVSACLFFGLHPFGNEVTQSALRSRLIWSGVFILLVGVVSFGIASVQLLPSFEYAPLARRWSAGYVSQFQIKMPYDITSQTYMLSPRSLFAFLFGASNIGGSEFSTYFGVMPLILTVIGVWQNWEKPWVRYLTVLAGVAYFYSMGYFSLLHGLVYLLVPFMDKAWEADRFIYLTHFSTAVLAGFGVQTLFSGETRFGKALASLNQVLKWYVIVLLTALGITALFWRPEIGDWFYVSFFFTINAWAIYLYIIRGNRNNLARFLLFAVIVCDLNVFNWTIQSKRAEKKQGTDYLEQMMSIRPVADFLKSQGGLFRIEVEGENFPTSLGDIFEIQSTSGFGATMLDDYLPVRYSPNGSCLLNVRYIVSSRKDRKETPVFASGQWKVYEKPSYYPRAWVVRNVKVEPSHQKVVERIQAGRFEPSQVAFMSERLEIPLDTETADNSQISFGHYQEDEMGLTVTTQAPGLLVLSEIFYPGWEATINDKVAHIYKVDGILRGLVIPQGESRIVMRYRPRTLLVGSVLSTISVTAIVLFGVMAWYKKRNRTVRN